MAKLDLTYITSNVSSEPEFIREILTVFLESLPVDKSALIESIEAQKHDDVKRAAHKLKSSFRTLGFTEASSQLEEMENLARNNADISEIKNVMIDFESNFPLIVTDVENYLANH